MCGIAGYWNIAGGKRDAFREELNQAVVSLHHRGPDDSGLWLNDRGDAGLGHARLAILDLSQHGHQPMVSGDGRYAMVFNGEVYNFREIRKELESKGFRFHGSGDSEVVLAAFQAWGVECVHRFIGMFAFAIWDEKEQKMFLFRDRVGVKPLYYGWDGKVFWFGSELKALRAFKHWSPEINRQALGEFFQYGYIAAPRTIYQQVHKLPPGHWLEISREKAEPVIRRYWSVLDAVAKGPLQASEDELADQLEELLISAFRYRLVSDVPVGVFLSGGIDSSIVAAILQKHSEQQIHTFTIGFQEDGYDESGWAKKVAGHLGSEQHEWVLNRSDAEEMLDRLADFYDEPFGDDSAIPTCLVSKMARQSVKVALSADGGDELFGGYTSYTLNPSRYADIARVPFWARRSIKLLLSEFSLRAAAASATLLAPAGSEFPTRLIRKLTKLRHTLPEPTPGKVYIASQSYWLPEEVDQLLSGYKDPRPSIDEYSGTFEEKMMQWDFLHYLQDDILVKVDRASMAVSLEGREPLLDHRLIEFAFRLPLHLRIGRLGQKHLLRKVLYKYVPQSLIDRKKQGFAIPKNLWMGKGRAERYHGFIREQGALNALLDKRCVEQELAVHGHTYVNEGRVWLLYIAAQWLDRWMK